MKRVVGAGLAIAGLLLGASALAQQGGEGGNAGGGVGGNAGDGAGGHGGSGGGCAHDLCALGEPLDPNCDPCVADLCGQDSYCCSTYWDDACVANVPNFCGVDCGNGGSSGGGGGSGGAEACAHDVCSIGPPLDPSCDDPCVEKVCLENPSCCDSYWDATCVGLAIDLCGEECGTSGVGGYAAHTDYDGDGYTEFDGDCDDHDAAVHPSATEKCGDQIDNDCDGKTNENCPSDGYHDGGATPSANMVSGILLTIWLGFSAWRRRRRRFDS